MKKQGIFLIAIVVFVFNCFSAPTYSVPLGELTEGKESRFAIKLPCQEHSESQENVCRNKDQHRKTWPVLGVSASSLWGGSAGIIISHILVLNESLYGSEYERANAGAAVIGAALLGIPSGMGGYFLGKKANLGSTGAKVVINAQLIIGVPLFAWAIWFLGFHPQ